MKPISIKAPLLLLVMLALVLSGCLSQPTPMPDTPTPLPTATNPPPVVDAAWDRVQANGKMVVAISPDYAPFAFVRPDFVIDGFEIALMQAIGQRLNIPLEFRNMAFDGIGAALQLGQVDAAIATISVTNERRSFSDFSNVYYIGEGAALAPQGSTVTVNSEEDLANYRVGVQRGSIFESQIRKSLVDTGKMPAERLLSYDRPADALDAMQAQPPLVDVVVMDRLPADAAATERGLVVVATDINPQSYAIALPLNSPQLAARINDALLGLQNDGTVAALAKQYLDIENLPPLPTPEPTQPVPTATAAPCLDGMTFVQDLNFDDNNMTTPARFAPGTPFTKGWRIRNSGTCTWDNSYVFSYVGGNNPQAQMSGLPTPIQGSVAPGQFYDMYVNLVAPLQPGTYQGFWSLRNGRGQFFGDRVWVGVQVASPVVPPTATSVPPPTVTSVPPQAPVINSFDVAPAQIQQGQCVNISWNYNGQSLALVQLLRNEQPILSDFPLSGSTTDCPPGAGQIEYRLVVSSEFGGQAQQSAFVQVDSLPPPTIDSFTLTGPEGQPNPSMVFAGQCVTINWAFSGSNLTGSQLTRNDQVLASSLNSPDDWQDCLTDPTVYGDGSVTYRIQVDSTSGSVSSEITLMVAEPR